MASRIRVLLVKVGSMVLVAALMKERTAKKVAGVVGAQGDLAVAEAVGVVGEDGGDRGYGVSY